MWEFRVKNDCAEQFESIYGPDGEWVKLFRKGNGYLRTELHRDLNISNRYITIDYWESKEAYDIFRNNFQNDFEKLDNQCEFLTEKEQFIGSFSSLPSK